MIARAFHAWERRLASVDQNRLVRPFEWGLDWLEPFPLSSGEQHAQFRPGVSRSRSVLPNEEVGTALGLNLDTADPAAAMAGYASRVMSTTDEFYAAPRLQTASFDGHRLEFESPIRSPHPENNRVTLRVFPARPRAGDTRRRAVVVLPQWNSDEGGHVGLCQGLAYFGITALRLVLPYHEQRRPPEIQRADYIVSSNVGQTLSANRQAVLDAKRAIDWLEDQGYDRIGIMGTSLGSCLSMLAMSHDSRVRAGVFNHISPYFADVVWSGLSTRHVRAGLEGHVTLDALRNYWAPISPWPFIDRVRDRKILLVYARYDLTFPVDLSRMFLREFARREIPHEIAVLPCGHYTTGRAPFKFIDGYYIVRHLLRHL